jgi:hypothetical protein
MMRNTQASAMAERSALVSHSGTDLVVVTPQPAPNGILARRTPSQQFAELRAIFDAVTVNAIAFARIALEIKESRAYLELGYESFPIAMEKEFGKKKSIAYDLLNYAKQVAELTDVGVPMDVVEAVVTERKARALKSERATLLEEIAAMPVKGETQLRAAMSNALAKKKAKTPKANAQPAPLDSWGAVEAKVEAICQSVEPIISFVTATKPKPTECMTVETIRDHVRDTFDQLFAAFETALAGVSA